MFLFHWLRSGKPAGSAAGPGGDGDPRTLLFESSRIAAGIVFHLLDQDLASAVDPVSSEAARDDFARRHVRLTVGRDRWANMSNPQRLRWLLEESHTGITFRPDRTAILLVCGRDPTQRIAIDLTQQSQPA